METTEDTTFGTCKLDSKNRITLPGKVLDFLKIRCGDFVSIERADGGLRLHKAYIVVRRNSNVGGGMKDGDNIKV